MNKTDSISTESIFRNNDHHYYFSDSLDCHVCGTRLFTRENDTYTWSKMSEKGLPCPHVVFMVKESGNTEFIKVRPDFSSPYIQNLIKTEDYLDHIKKPQTLPLKANEIGYFASGTFSHNHISDHNFSYIDNIGMRVGNFMEDLDPLVNTDFLPDDTIIFDSSFTLGKMYVGGYSNTIRVFIALSSTQYLEPRFSDLSTS